MNDLKFTWDEKKALKNQTKHNVSFEEAITVFLDDFGRLILDPEHSEDEDRFILLGKSNKFKFLLVCHCYRKNGEEIRIISARKANNFEQKQYRGFS